MLRKGLIVQFKTDKTFVGVIENLTSLTIYIRYLKIDTSLNHININYTTKNFHEYWEVI